MDVSDGERREAPAEPRVRPARPEDRDAVLAFCARTWSDGDYIAEVWDDWLGNQRGVLLVATLAERPVGLVHVRMLSADEGWLEGIRVDPAVRRQGVGRVLTSRGLVAARERGAGVARLFTTWDNVAAQAMFGAFGFTRIAQVTYYEAAAEDAVQAGATSGSGQGQRLVTPGADAFERLWGWLEQSNLAPFNGGLEFLGWAARALTEPRLRAHLAAGEVLTLEEWDTIQALAIVRDQLDGSGEPGRLEVRYLDGMADGIGRLALALRALAAERGLATIQLFLPDLLILRDAMDGAGYASEGEGAMWVYARDL